MKSFKIVFASLMIAALGIVGFSSFKSEAAKAPKKALVEQSFVYTGTAWIEEENPESFCASEGVLCGISFDDTQISESAAKSFALGLTQAQLNAHTTGTAFPNGVIVYEKAQ